MKKFLLYISAITTIIASLAVNEATAAERPRLLVNIVVSGMRTDDLVRYNKNFSNGGFNRLINNGAYFTNASYDYMQTTTPVGLATLSTGAMPSTHGVVSDSWFDYVGNKRVSLIEDSKEQCVNYSGDAIGYSPRQLIAETISDAMIQSDSTSQVATIAIEPLSAIVTAGHSGEVYWMETLQTAWTTSSYYAKELPAWITQYNQTDKNLDFITKRWNALLEYDNYLNSRVACIEGLKSKQNKRIDHIEEDAAAINKIFSDEY
ncbi:MAG: alkaline phosphatase family protein, partial [Alistipes sp.]|nr:alkaline phosphatase family protein [Alistipes sp.]